MATFADILPALKDGQPVFRIADPNASFTFRQIPATIGIEIIPKMTSVPEKVKALMLARNNAFSYHDQVVQVLVGGSTTYRAFTHEDLFADDWHVWQIETNPD